MDPSWSHIAGLQTIAEREALLLAPYATHSTDTQGRRHAEPVHAYRGPFQRDRDRIVHSSAFRRLSGKMQVFTGDMGDYHRTRLTHTHEVASIARTIGRTLRLNEDLIEALALFHDIGHPPYGHAGEEALHTCLLNHGGFSHNQYALTIAEELEIRYHEFPGLNLSHEVLEGQAMRIDKSRTNNCPPLEVQVVDLADSITYDAHDTDDAIKLGLVSLPEIATIPLVRETMQRVHEQQGKLTGPLMRKAIVHMLIDVQVSDVLHQAGVELARHSFVNAAAAQATNLRFGPSPSLQHKKQELEAFLYSHVYRHPKLIAMRELAQNRLQQLFRAFCVAPHCLPERFRRRAEAVGLERSVGDYVAGMTDRFCEQQAERLVSATCFRG
jgi:dGTPase